MKNDIRQRKDNGIYRKALALAIPMMIQNGITNAVGLVDNVMVGSLGTESMTAVSITGQLIFVFNLAIFGGLSGPGIYGAQYFGQGNNEGVKNIFRLKWWIILACVATGITIFMTHGKDLINLYLRGEGTDIDAALTLSLGWEYMSIMVLGMLPFAITQVYAGSLRETGESLKPMIAGICSVVVDILFNYLLIYGKFGFPKMGVRGAAIATVLARVAEMCIVIISAHIKRNKHVFLQGIYKTMKVPKEIMTKVSIKGLPIFFNELMWAGAIAFLTQCFSRRGLNVVAGMNISNAICNLLNVVFVALGNAVGIISGQLLGASEYEKAKKNTVKLMWFTGGICVGIAAILIAVSGVFPNLYETTDDVKHLGTMFIIITAAFFPVQGFLNALYFTIRSGGKTLITFLFDSVYSWVATVSVVFCLVTFTDFSIFVIYAISQSMDIIKLIIGYILFKKEVWVTNLVEDM